MTNDVITIERVARLFTELGPVIFALLFLLVLTIVAQRWYARVSTRKATENEKATYRWIFVGTAAFGVVFAAVAAAGYYFDRRTHYVFDGVVEDTRDDEELWQYFLYTRVEIKREVKQVAEAGLGSGGQEVSLRPTRIHFAFVRDTPFLPGELFVADLRQCATCQPRDVKICYEKTNRPLSYVRRYSTERNESLLVPRDGTGACLRNYATPSASPVVGFLIRSAAAQVGQRKTDDIFSKSIALRQSFEPLPERHGFCGSPAFEVIILCPGFVAASKILPAREVLTIYSDAVQEPRTDIQSKAIALDYFLDPPNIDLRTWFREEHTSVDLGVALLDLTRHSEPEVSAKSRKVLELIDFPQYVRERGMSSKAGDQLEAVRLLTRADPSVVQAALSKGTPQHENKIILDRFTQRYESQFSSKLVRPSGTASGDRYYVRAEWSPLDENTQECLTDVFKSTLLSKRTREEESALMRNRTNRIVYWYSAEWAIYMYDKIRGCGGKASFVQF